ncbi:MAG: YfcC family protein, partial [Firmicutes bacterium]|nr:YfcC family protein [Bacillota bacterium]
MEKAKKGFKMPHTYVILIAVVLVMAICTYIIPAGQYERVEDPNTERMVVNPDNYQLVENNPTKFFDLFKSIPVGMNAASDIIFFIFCTGGAFEIMLATGAIDRGIGALAKKAAGKEKILIPIVVFIFSLGGATFGMSEESIVFVPIGIALARAVGYDALVGMSMIALGCAVGFNSAWMNPFTVGVAQGIAELPTFSGIEMRLVIHVVFFIITSAYIMRYAT